jgi:hypothetical protein
LNVSGPEMNVRRPRRRQRSRRSGMSTGQAARARSPPGTSPVLRIADAVSR